jgi:predicted DNA binding protein
VNLFIQGWYLVIVRRLVYEAYIGRRFLGGPLSENVRVVEVLSVLRHRRREISVICRVEFKDPSTSSALFDDDKAEVQVLEREDHAVCTVFVRRALPDPPKGLDPTSVYLSPPWRVEEGMGRVTLLGSAKEIRRILRELEKTGMPYRIISLNDAKFSTSSLLGLLTGKQRAALSAAFELGYYDIPRKTSSDELAMRLGMSNPAFVAHRRKAEKRLLAEILNTR